MKIFASICGFVSFRAAISFFVSRRLEEVVPSSWQALYGIIEVFFDTFVICTFTALIIMVSGVWNSGVTDGTVLATTAFRQNLGGLGQIVIVISLLLFCLSVLRSVLIIVRTIAVLFRRLICLFSLLIILLRLI